MMTNSRNNLTDLIVKYQSFSEERKREHLWQLQKDFKRFKSALTEIQKEAEEKDRKVASQYNIFRLLGVAYDEVNTHSPFLANLLNPAGTHAQGYLFLDTFWQMCADKYKTDGFPIPEGNIHNGYWRIEREKWTSYGRPDLVISNSKLSYLLVIENKIRTDEQNDQLLRYTEWLTSQQIYYEQQALIYLTPRGDHSYTAGNSSYFPMSYREDIYHWLDRVQANIKAPRVQESIRQYMEIIGQLYILR